MTKISSQVLKRCALSIATAALVATAGAVVAQQNPGPVGTPPMSSEQQLAADLVVQAYWTPERMASAKPMERFAPGTEFAAQTRPMAAAASLEPRGLAHGATPAMARAYSAKIGEITILSAADAQPQDYGVAPSDPLNGVYGPFQRFAQAGAYVTYPISTVGKLFFTEPGNGNFVCSGTAINRSTIVTAGHCVAKGDNVTWYNSFLFCPSYNAGGVNPAVGCWSWSQAFTSFQWFSSGNQNYDYACIVTATTGTIKANKLGNITGWAGRAWNWPTSMAEVSMGYPQAAPFDGKHIQVSSAPDWYSYDFGKSTGGVGASKFMGNDLTGGSSGGPWILGYMNGAPGAEAPDVDGNGATDPGAFWVNGVNSHKRCAGSNCNSPPTATDGVFWDEMSSPRFTSTGADNNDSEDVFANCFANSNNN